MPDPARTDATARDLPRTRLARTGNTFDADAGLPGSIAARFA